MSPSFQAHAELLQAFLQRRSDIVACIDRLLNCQKKAIEYQQDLSLLSRQFKDCFLAPGALTDTQRQLRDELEHAHWAAGFRPRAQPGNELVDPAEQMRRAFHLWRATHWPGQKGRIRFAHTLFNLHVVRSLALLCMRLWDDAAGGVPERLARLQAVLDALWKDAPADQPRLVRDVRWLFPVAMSPTTDSLAGYFTIAERIAATFAEADRVETQKAWVVTGAGHLRSQLRDLAQRRNVAIDAPGLVLLTRVSNALDVSLLMEGLVTLLDAYAQACQNGAAGRRAELASAICQGMSPDPELFVNRVDLLGPYTMIEHLFVTTDGAGQAVYTAAGQRHLALLQRYIASIESLAQPLYEDQLRSAATQNAWTPYGALYGFASNLLELIAFRTLARDAATDFSMEDVFTDGGADKRAWIDGWRALPHIKPELVKQFEYPQEFAAAMHARVTQALQRRLADTAQVPAGRLYIAAEPGSLADARLAPVPDLPRQYRVSSDPQIVAAHGAEPKDQSDLLHCRNEGEYLVSYPTAHGWAALSKDLLTEVLGAGLNAKISLPAPAAALLKLMCPGLVAAD